jgi:kynurenine 3-monooxygenase
MLTDEHSTIKIFFEHIFVSGDKHGNILVKDLKTEEIISPPSFDLLVGADGAFSLVREDLLKRSRINFSRDFIDLGYKELHIPPTVASLPDGQIVEKYALDRPYGLHIWPRGRFMLIALPNPDLSFTATLFAPYSGEDGFDSLHNSDSDESTREYFKRHFPDVEKLMPFLSQDFRNNPVGSLVTVRTNPWNSDSTVLIGDAAHAVVPFYGQGFVKAFLFD